MAKIRLVCISDTHGLLPTDLPDGDILVHAGDICPFYNHDPIYQTWWLNIDFKNWIRSLKYKAKVIIAGNHDWAFQHYNSNIDKGDYCYLENTVAVVLGIKFWGTPCSMRFHDWAFNKTDEELSYLWELIPKDTDVVLSHGPPYGIGDSVYRDNPDEEQWPILEHTGSKSLLENLNENSYPLLCNGHIHPGYAVYQHHTPYGISHVANCALLNDSYQLVNKPHIFDFDTETRKVCIVPNPK